MNKEYTEEDDDFVEVEPNGWEMIEEDEKYQTFQLWENLKNLDLSTIQLLAKGFLEEITKQSLGEEFTRRARQYRKLLSKDAWLSRKSEDYGDSEYFRGKAEAYEECAGLISLKNLS